MIHSRVGIVVLGQDLPETFDQQTGAFVQTALGPFVREAYAADCTRFLAELRGRRVSPGQDLRSIEAQPRTG
jgi:hypothetical protein